MTEIPYELPLDADGFLRRKCEGCEQDFKWHYGPTGSRPSNAVEQPMYYCPLCGRRAALEDWTTDEQQKYQQQVVEFYMHDVVGDALKREFRRSKSISIKMNKNTASAPTAYIEPNDMIILEPPCHPWEPVKVPQERADSGSLFCIVCGQEYVA